ncbi:uncharacterized protein [Henckelia pumila]|uniref:uncharacterized protein n=1 Tax=Henckelia pumila TaxID=405737 RepID=UPI003C6E1805
MMQKFISSTETKMQNQDASIKNLENQIGKLAKAMNSRELGTLPSDTEKNPKEQVKAVELRSGKRIEPERQGKKEPEPSILDKTAGKSSTSTQPPTSQSNIIIPPPFPAALKKVKLDSQFAKFLEVFKKLNINIPFADALMQMPSYAKLLKEILSSKRKLEEHAMISLTENCYALVQNKIPPKQKDLGSFSIPCVINDVQFHKSLCDLGSSINLMPYSIFRKLSLGEPKSTRMSLQSVDRSIKYPRGIIEDVLVKVDKFIFPVDFFVLDMEEDLDMTLILGRPFLSTGKALTDVQKGELLLREPLEAALISPPHEDIINVGIEKMTAYLNDNQSWRKGGKLRLEDFGDRKDLVLQKPSLEEPPTVELKPLPAHLKYVFLGENENLPAIISSSLTDGYSGYNQIAIAPKDQDKTNFTCLYGTFAYRRMPFGLCNAPATFQRFMTAIFHDMMRGDELGTKLGKVTLHGDRRYCIGHRILEQGIEVDRAKAFESLREILVTAPVLTSPNWDLPFEVMCDASDSVVGAVLEERIDKFHSYLVLLKITVYTDHSTIRHLLAKKDAKPRLIRWILLLQEFDLEIKDKKGIENVVADHLSRLECILDCAQNDTEDIDYWFPDEKLFAIENSPCCQLFCSRASKSTFPCVLFTPPNLWFNWQENKRINLRSKGEKMGSGCSVRGLAGPGRGLVGPAGSWGGPSSGSPAMGGRN